MIPIVGFAPDADKTTPGILTDCQHLLPFEAGYRGAPSSVAATVPALATQCQGSVVAILLDGTSRVFAGTPTKLWELVSGAWVDRSSGAYTGGTNARWSFCQFGNTTIASNFADAMQSSAAGAFAAVGGGAPKAKIVVSASNNFVMAFNTNDGTYGVSPDRWWCCAQTDQTNWTPSVSTLATTGRLVGVEGEIIAGMALGDYVVAYKKRAIFVGSFAGPPVVWQFSIVPSSECGAVGQEAVCDLGGSHFFVSEDNFWMFDGTRPVPVGIGVIRKWFFANVNPVYLYRTRCTYEKQNNQVRVSYVSRSSLGVVDSSIVYHIATKQWGRDDVVSQASINYISPGVTIDGLDAYSSTIDGLPEVPIDSPYWTQGGRVASYFNGSNQLTSFAGVTQNSYFITGDFGDDQAVTMMQPFRARFEKMPATAVATGYYKFNEGDPLTQGAVSSINDGKFDLRQSGRFHRVLVNMTGDVTVYGFNTDEAATVLVGGR
jgi:hypothetical protein